MDFEFRNKKLYKLYTSNENVNKFPQEVVKSFNRVMAIIDSASDERDIRAFKGLRFERLQRNRDQISLRLNDQWRLIIEIVRNEKGKLILIIDIEDYH